MKDIAIRAAIDSDVTAIRSCAREAYARYIPRMDREPAPMHAPFGEQVVKGHVLVVEVDGEFAGYAVSYPEDDHVHLENIAVAPRFAGRGVGKQLIAEVEAVARESGFAAVELYTNEAMTENLAMYPKLGYAEIERRREDGFNRVFYRKSL